MEQEKHTLKIFPVALTAFWPDTTHKLLFALAISRRRFCNETPEKRGQSGESGLQFLPGCTAPVCQSIVVQPLAALTLGLSSSALTSPSLCLSLSLPFSRYISVVASLFLSPAFQYNFHGPPLQLSDGCSISFGNKSRWGRGEGKVV